ncbi:hypothetical protein GCM10010358_66960 [Streptomyces minutiscleroticus]|uniref:Uncharacterized protein n=1 Tax=Streptomyces minutiscleroticus TaxID=68238 RepID=A0A918NXQ5_9ACTN|nr:hypothetical protein GCM10010358_66960 [Streptomyces minutiscleroticus]
MRASFPGKDFAVFEALAVFGAVTATGSPPTGVADALPAAITVTWPSPPRGHVTFWSRFASSAWDAFFFRAAATFSRCALAASPVTASVLLTFRSHSGFSRDAPSAA